MIGTEIALLERLKADVRQLFELRCVSSHPVSLRSESKSDRRHQEAMLTADQDCIIRGLRAELQIR